MPWFEYYSNNSGGEDWLDPENWAALRKAGAYICGWDGPCEPEDRPKYAYIQAPDLEAAIQFFEEHAQQDYYATGCPCCGAPHYISEERGEDLPDWLKEILATTKVAETTAPLTSKQVCLQIEEWRKNTGWSGLPDYMRVLLGILADRGPQ